MASCDQQSQHKVVLSATNARPTSRLNNEHQHGCTPLFKLSTIETKPLLFNHALHDGLVVVFRAIGTSRTSVCFFPSQKYQRHDVHCFLACVLNKGDLNRSRWMRHGRAENSHHTRCSPTRARTLAPGTRRSVERALLAIPLLPRHNTFLYKTIRGDRVRKVLSNSLSGPESRFPCHKKKNSDKKVCFLSPSCSVCLPPSGYEQNLSNNFREIRETRRDDEHTTEMVCLSSFVCSFSHKPSQMLIDFRTAQILRQVLLVVRRVHFQSACGFEHPNTCTHDKRLSWSNTKPNSLVQSGLAP